MPAPQWSPTDYLLHGRFCPPEDLFAAAEDLRATVEAHTILLLVAGPRGLLRLLCACVSADRGTAEAVTEFLRHGPKVRVKRRLRPPTAAAQQRGEDYPRTTPRLLRVLKGAATRAERTDVVEALGDLDQWVGARLPAQLEGTRLGIAILAQHPDDAFVLQEEGLALLDCPSEVLRVGIMANATAHARVHHDAIITTRVDEKLDPDMFASGDIDLSVAAGLLVELAAEVSSSDAAAYYASDPVHNRLSLQAAGPPESELDFPASIPFGSPAAAATSVQRRRPVAHGWEGSEVGVEFTFAADAQRTQFVEMATPVPGPLASSRIPATGVLTVVRGEGPERGPNPYGAYDHALLRNVALRLALLRSTANLETAAEMFERLTVQTVPGNLPALDPDRSVDERETSHPVPDDLALALPTIEAGLRNVAALTASHSATFRAALPDRRTRLAHGLALVRVAAYPRARLDDADPIQRLEERGVNCRAAETGSAQNVPFVDLDPEFHSIHEGTASEISVPVVVEGMVLGVINLESRIEQNYDARGSTAIAFAQHIGVVIANARLALARDIQRHAIQAITEAHDLSYDCDALVRLTTDAGHPFREKIRTASRDIETRALRLREYRVSAQEPEPATTPVLVQKAWRLAALDLVDEDIDSADWPAQGPRSGAVLLECLRHVFQNVQKHMPLDSNTPQVRVTTAEWGGRTYEVIQVRNETKHPFTALRAANVYRVPVKDRAPASTADHEDELERPGFGAYLAGSHARFLGGAVHLVEEGDRNVCVTAMVPRPSAEERDG